MAITFSPQLIEALSDLFFNTDQNKYDEVDTALFSVFHEYPGNTDFGDVLIKATLLNSLYGTNIYKIVSMVEHICRLSIDDKIQRNDLSVVDDLRIGHGIGNGQNERNFYSFATKYIHFHNPSNFPLFDQLVKRFVTNINKEILFHSRFKQTDLHDYAYFKEVIDSLITKLNIPNFGYNKIDKGLWVYSKYLYKREELSEEFILEIEDIIQNQIA